MKKLSIYLGVCLILGFVVYREFQPTDEIGYLGAGKIGRQVLIQRLDTALKSHGSVSSDFSDRPFILNLFIGAPLTTTIRFYFSDKEANTLTNEKLKQYLNTPQETITQFFEGDVKLQNGFEMNSDEFRDFLKKKKVVSIEDLFSGFGFKKYEVYIKGEPKFSIELSKTRNVKHLGD